MANRNEIQDLQIENAKIMFRNFKGEPDKFNPSGKRTFAVFLEPDEAAAIEEEIINSFIADIGEYFPPTVNVISGRKHSRMDADTIGMLDWAEIDTVDLIIRPYVWEMNGRTGIKAYLKKMWVTLLVDKFEEKYANFADVDDVPFDV